MGILNKLGKKKAPAKKAEKAEEKKAVKAEAAKAAAPKGPLAREGAGSAYRILLKPVFTEKSGSLQAMGKYVFIVHPSANKNEVKAAIRDLYGVAPVSVNIIKEKGNTVRFGRTMGREKDEKKAIVTLKAGETLAVVEGA